MIRAVGAECDIRPLYTGLDVGGGRYAGCQDKAESNLPIGSGDKCKISRVSSICMSHAQRPVYLVKPLARP